MNFNPAITAGRLPTQRDGDWCGTVPHKFPFPFPPPPPDPLHGVLGDAFQKLPGMTGQVGDLLRSLPGPDARIVRQLGTQVGSEG